MNVYIFWNTSQIIWLLPRRSLMRSLPLPLLCIPILKRLRWHMSTSGEFNERLTDSIIDSTKFFNLRIYRFIHAYQHRCKLPFPLLDRCKIAIRRCNLCFMMKRMRYTQVLRQEYLQQSSSLSSPAHSLNISSQIGTAISTLSFGVGRLTSWT